MLSIDGPKLTLLTRSGEIVRVDDSAAAANQRIAILTVGHSYTVVSDSAVKANELKALAITRAKPSASIWPEDR